MDSNSATMEQSSSFFDDYESARDDSAVTRTSFANDDVEEDEIVFTEPAATISSPIRNSFTRREGEEFQKSSSFFSESARDASAVTRTEFTQNNVQQDTDFAQTAATKSRHRPSRQSIITKREDVKFPSDCYSFLALHGPFTNPKFFFFGMFVWAFQITLHLLLVLRVASRSLREGEDTDNPWNQSFFSFIPSNVGIVSRIAQFLALAAYCIFADESVKDIIKSVEFFPRFDRTKEGDKVACMVFSSCLRFSQGFLATIVVLLLVIQTSDVIEIILNFTAVNFISAFDDSAFELAKWGKFGQDFKDESHRIQDLILPKCLFQKRDHGRYRYVISTITTTVLLLLTSVSFAQLSSKVWLTKRLRVQFKDGSLFEDFSGCYDLEPNASRLSLSRRNYDSFEANSKRARFGYCERKHKWFLYEDQLENACDAEALEIIAYSGKLYTFDIVSSFEEPWYSSSGRPLELYFFEGDSDEVQDDVQCNAFLGDGICNDFFNSAEYDYDEGDCCATTCDQTRCGIGSLKIAFDTDVVNGNGFPHCMDKNMQAVTIRLNDVYLPEVNAEALAAYFGQLSTTQGQAREPLMILDCDGKNVLMVSINEYMKNKTETVMVADAAKCMLKINNSTLEGTRMWYVDYTIFHGSESDVDSNAIVMVEGDSFREEVNYFQRIPKCYFNQLEGHIDLATIYTGTNASNQAIDWLMKDSSGFSSCELDGFLDRYALATINFAAPMVSTNLATQTNDQGLWITGETLCVWPAVGCTNGNIVTELNYEDLDNFTVSGTIATEIGLLKNITRIGLGLNELYSTIPSEIGQLNDLSYMSLTSNFLTGSIPAEVGELTKLNVLDISINSLTGTIPSEVGKMTSLDIFWVYLNSLSGTIPSEVGQLSSLYTLTVDGNFLTGTIPSEIGELNDLRFLQFSYNFITGSIPNETGQLTSLLNFVVDFNHLTGSIPSGLLDSRQIDVFGNKLSNLIPIDDYVICSDSEGEHYCNCENHCFSFLELPGNHKCACEEARACCETVRELYSPCLLCKYGNQNPDFQISVEVGTCETNSFQTLLRIKDYGTAKKCDGLREAREEAGCLCNDTPPSYQECIICEFGFENPDLYIELYGGTCQGAQLDVSENRGKYGSRFNCARAELAVTRMGCKCNDRPPSPLIECIVCEFGLENPDMYVNENRTCSDVSDYMRQDLTLYGKESQCVDAQMSMDEAGCYCKDNLGSS